MFLGVAPQVRHHQHDVPPLAHHINTRLHLCATTHNSPSVHHINTPSAPVFHPHITHALNPPYKHFLIPSHNTPCSPITYTPPPCTCIPPSTLPSHPSSCLHPFTQLLGSLDLPEGPVACAVLKHVARAYPRALYHPYHITEEFLGKQGLALCTSTETDTITDLNNGGSSSSSSSSSRGSSSASASAGAGPRTQSSAPIQKQSLSLSLRDLLRDESSDALVTALDGLTHPQLRLRGE